MMRGKLDMPGTIRNKLQRRIKLDCIFDEFSENNLFNQILKATMMYLLRAEEVKLERKAAIRKLLVFFDGIGTIDPTRIQWDRLHYQRNNRNYELLMNVCYFVLNGMLQTTESGEYRVATFSDDHMARLYEKFILEFYREHCPWLSEVKAGQVKWNIDSDASLIRFLPTMQTDIMLRLGEKTLIIDAKYYGETLQKQYDKYTLRSAHVYQIFSYVKNLDSKHSGNVGGILLYAKTNEDIVPDGNVTIDGNMIAAQTLDLNVDFRLIEEQLMKIATGFFGLDKAARYKY